MQGIGRPSNTACILENRKTSSLQNMVQKLEDIRNGGGSIRLGTTGTIGTLMSRELESMKSAAEAPLSSRGKPKSIAVSVSCSANTSQRLQPRKPSNEASSSGSSNNIKRPSPETPRKQKSYPKSTHRVPMLGSENSSLDRTPSRAKPEKKAANIVEIVDIKCGHPDRAWATPITSKLKKLGFSKLSESMI